MRAAKIVERKVNLKAIDVNVRVIGESQPNAVINGENELAVRDVILQAVRSRQRGRELLPA